MSFIQPLKTFSHEDLFYVLQQCEKSLEDAYQMSLCEEMWLASCQAKLACEYLLYEIKKQQGDYQIH